MELAIRTAITSWASDHSRVVFDPDLRNHSRKTESVHIAFSSRLNLNAILIGIDETRVNFTVEVGELSVSEREFDSQIRFHRRIELNHDGI